VCWVCVGKKVFFSELRTLLIGFVLQPTPDKIDLLDG